MKLKEAWRGGRQWKGAKATAPGRQRIHQQWMAAFSDEIEKLNPKMAGRIDWDSAQTRRLGILRDIYDETNLFIKRSKG